MIKFDEATRAQVLAADPIQNTWVSANAGSGKTRVLTDRVARLLLHDTDPQRILCLTYTKAAAAEMQNRLFKRLGEWAMMADNDLRQALEQLGEETASLTPPKLSQARTLFAAALETPGGLKIQTIHSFCDALLRRFPLEAGVAPQFKVLEERQATQLRAEIVEQMASDADTSAIDALAQYYTRMDTDDLTQEIVKMRGGFDVELSPDLFGIDDATTLTSIKQDLLSDLEDFLFNLLKKMEHGSDAESKLSIKAQEGLKSASAGENLSAVEGLFLTKSGTIKARQIPTAKVFSKDDPIREEINEVAELVAQARDQRLSLGAFNRTSALHKFAKKFLSAYDRRKAFGALLDYDDLINLAAKLLTQSTMAQWVLYRLDGGLDHILVDEAQDTSPAQWAVVDCLAREFTYGASANDRPRSLFVVGDEKQSIYSFQGADPDVFGEKKVEFKDLLTHIDQDLANRELLHSFRSAPPVLDLVDKVFDGPAGSAMTNRTLHKAFHATKPGRVDLWPLVEKEKDSEKPVWHRPVDLPSPSHPKRRLAQNIARNLKALLDSGQNIDVEGVVRPVTAGDILILVQGRGGQSSVSLFQEILKELKQAGLPVAGADRLNVGDELAVRDILSLLQFASMADDDLALAEAMRSPILGLSEGDLFRVAHGRKGTLWQSFRDMDGFEDTLEILHDIRAQVDFMRPYELIERILVKHKGRENLLARLGPEIEDGVDELLSQAMQYETMETPTLTGFLHWFASGEVDIKRDMGSSGNIRVMTVHGAKGLEAPIVILPDTVNQDPSEKDQVKLVDDIAIWRSTGDDKSAKQMAAEQLTKDRDISERMRLLYVAMTRAESWLIVCGQGEVPKETGNKWYYLIADAMQGMGATPTQFAGIGDGLSLQNAEWETLGHTPETKDEGTAGTVAIPDWMSRDAAKIARPDQPIAPSKLGGAKALPNDDALPEEQAKRRGRLLHKLLEHMPSRPPESWAAFADQLLTSDSDAPDEALRSELISEATALLQNPDLRHIFFDPNSLAEVGITSPLAPIGKNMMGYIDRLIISEDTVLAVDFKSNAGIPDSIEKTPKGILAQQAAYLLGLQQIYPDHAIEIAILWTRTGRIMTIPHNIAIKALDASQHLDD